MRVNYRAIKQTLFHDLEFLALPRDARDMLVYLRLMSTNIIALYRPDWETIDSLLGFKSRQERDRVLHTLSAAKSSGQSWVMHEQGYVWIVKGFAFELGDNDDGQPHQPNEKHCINIWRALDALPSGLTLPTKFCCFYRGIGYGEKFDRVCDTLLAKSGKGIDDSAPASASAPAPAPAPASAPVSTDALSLSDQAYQIVSRNFPDLPSLKDKAARVRAWAVEADRFLKRSGKTAREVSDFLAWAGADVETGQARQGRRPWTGWRSQFQSMAILSKETAWAAYINRNVGKVDLGRYGE
jgi:hypothetical protein